MNRNLRAGAAVTAAFLAFALVGCGDDEDECEGAGTVRPVTVNALSAPDLIDGRSGGSSGGSGRSSSSGGSGKSSSGKSGSSSSSGGSVSSSGSNTGDSSDKDKRDKKKRKGVKIDDDLFEGQCG